MALFTTLLAKIGIDTSDAQKDLKKTKDGAKDLGKQFEDMKSGVQNALLGLFAMEKVMQAVGAAVQFVKDSTAAYIESNKDAQAVLAGTSGKLQDMKKSLGEAIVGGDNLNGVMGAVNMVMDAMQHIIAENRDRIQEFVKSGVEVTIAVMAKLAYVVAGVVGVFQGLAYIIKMTWEGLKAFVNAVVLAGAAISAFSFNNLGILIRGFENVAVAGLKAAEVMADIAGKRELAQWAHDAQASVKGLSDQFQDYAKAAQEMSQTIGRGALEELEGNQARIVDLTKGIGESLERNLAAADSVNKSLTEGLENGALASAAIRGNIEGAANAASSVGGAARPEASAPADTAAAVAERNRLQMGEYYRQQEAAQAQAARDREAAAIQQVMDADRQRREEALAQAQLIQQKASEQAAAEAQATKDRIMAPVVAVQEAMSSLGEQAASSAREAGSALTTYFGQAFAGIISGSKKTDQTFGEMAASMAASMAGTFAQLFTSLGAGMLIVNPAAGIGLIAAGLALSTLASLLGGDTAKPKASTDSAAPSGPAAPSASNDGVRNVYLVQSNYDMFPTDEGNLRRFAGMNRMAREAGLMGYQTSAV